MSALQMLMLVLARRPAARRLPLRRPVRSGAVRMTANGLAPDRCSSWSFCSPSRSRSACTWPASTRGAPAVSTACSAPVERALYRLAGVDPQRGDDLAELRRRHARVQLRSGSLAVYALLSACQGRAAAEPGRTAAPSRRTPSFNTAVSFATNTNWQSYGGETTMSYLTQMLGAHRAELRLGRHRHGGAGRADPRLRAALSPTTIGNFWVDLVAHDALHPAAAVARPGAGAGLAGRRADPRRLPRRPTLRRAR